MFWNLFQRYYLSGGAARAGSGGAPAQSFDIDIDAHAHTLAAASIAVNRTWVATIGAAAHTLAAASVTLTHVAFEAESLAIFAAFSTPPDAARKDDINTLVLALKNASVWDNLDVLYVFAAADSQAAKINWKNPGTFDATEANSPTFTTDRGFKSDGTTSYLDTNFNASTAGGGYQRNDNHAAVWSRTDSTSLTKADWGHTNNLINSKRNATGPATRNNAASTQATSAADSLGYTWMYRTVNTTYQVGRNNNASEQETSTTSALTNLNYFVCAQCDSGPTASNFSNRELALCHWGSSLNDTDFSNMYSAFLTYLQAVGAA